MSVKLTVRTFAVLVAINACRPPAVVVEPIPEGIREDVTFIGSFAQEGRMSGSAGANRVANRIVQRYISLGLRGAFATDCANTQFDCTRGYFQPFVRQGGQDAKNIAAIIPGIDSTVRDEYVIVGAHYDHIGRSVGLSLDPDKGPEIRPGADDNASGTAAVMEIARRLSARPARRSVVVVHFDAEEVGLIGSKFFVSRSPIPLRKAKLMINLDMVGRLRQNGLEIDRSTLMYDDPELLAVADSIAKSRKFALNFTRKIEERSDHAPFRRGDVSALALFTGFHDDYHRTTDIVAKLDISGIGRVSDVAEALVRFAADRK